MAYISPSETEMKSGGAAAKKTYSPQELAELYMTSREDFLGLNLEEVTLNWNLNYIYDFLYLIREPETIDNIAGWLIIQWEKCHHVDMDYNLAFDKELKSKQTTFKDSLRVIFGRLVERYNREEREKELMAAMLAGYKPPTQTPPSANTSNDQTDEPHYERPDESGAPQYHISSLTLESQKILLIKGDETYSQLVEICRVEIWPWIKKNSLKSANAVRFVFRYLGFLPRKCSVLKFTNLFNEMVPDAHLKPDTVGSYKEANTDEFEQYEKLPDWKQLKKDGEALIAMLKPVSDLQKVA